MHTFNQITKYSISPKRYFFLTLLFLGLSLGLAWAQGGDTTATDGEGEASTEEATATGDQPSPEVLAKGEELWENNCTSCHALTEEVVVGPGLYNVWERTPSREWRINWIKNSQAMVQAGDDYAVKIFNEYNQNVMTSFPWPTEDIEAVLDYIKVASVEAMNPPKADGGGGDGEEPVVGTNPALGNYFNILLGVMVLVLALIVVVLILMLSILKRFIEQKEGGQAAEVGAGEDEEKSSFNLGKLVQNRAFINGVGLVFTLVVLKAVLDSLIGVGIQQGYAPTQPIPFSHKLHAGMYEIDCNYCHTGVNKGKSAVIPSANICMNCHNAIKRESPYIKKIYEHIENDEPIEWVRVHNLPDLAYFNHAQHVNVAGLECENCHGEIKQMEVVQQRAPLTMGWCINCHRQTIMDHAEDNEYYDRLIEYHDANSNNPMTVENIGGLECSKCHY